MKTKFLFLIILLISLFTLTGCTHSNVGIDNYNFIIALGIDESQDNLLQISVQASENSSNSKSSQSGSSQSSNSNIYSVQAHTIDEGISILNNYLSKPINLTHCSAIIISEKLAQKGIRTYINSLSNNTELRHTSHLIISSTNAIDVMKNAENSGEVFSARLYDYLSTTTDYTGYSIISAFGDFFLGLDNSSYQPSAVYTTVTDNIIQSNGIAVFKDDIMVGKLKAIDSISHLIITNKLEKSIITLDSPFDAKEKIDINLNLYKNTDIKIQLINNTPFISINVYPEGNIQSSGSTFNYTSEKNNNKLEDTLNNYLEKIIKDYLYKITKEYNSDIVGFEGLFQANFLTQDEFEKIHWDKIFQDSFYNIRIHSKVNSSNLFKEE